MGKKAPPEAIIIQTSVSEIDILEGGEANFAVRLSSRPRGDVLVNIGRTSGDPDISSATGPSILIKKRNYNRWHSVVLKASRDTDESSGQATFELTGPGLVTASVLAREVDQGSFNPPSYRIVTNRTDLAVPEGGSAGFQVRLSENPGESVQVLVSRLDGGDADIWVESGAVLQFDAGTWNSWQTVTLRADEDSDDTNGSATFALTSGSIPAVNLTATEQDNDKVGTSTVVLDPISRIEGHLRIEVEVAGGEVTKAWSTATLFRGIETILTNRNPHDAPLITQRLCGVCTFVHQLCSVRAIEDVAGLQIPENARIVRNLMLGAQYLHDHLVHFYHLHGLDWVDITSALAASPAATEALADSVSPDAPAIDFDAVKNKLQGFVGTGNLGPFANAYWGHSAYVLSPEENLLVTAHYLEALKQQLVAAKMMAILGGKNPHPQSTIVGGVTCGGELSPQRLADFGSYLEETRHFVNTVYLPDIKVLAANYPQWADVGKFDNFLACGEFPLGPDIPQDLFMPRGVIFNGDISNVHALDEAQISEHVARSWYSGATDRHPADGETVPDYTGMDLASQYSWLKAPRYDTEPMEVGPLARVLVGYGQKSSPFVNAVDGFLTDTGLSPLDLLSALGRTAARAIETALIADGMVDWLAELENRLNGGDKRIFQSYTLPSGTGVGFLEAPRGALGHWINTQPGAIENYQMVVPTTWNLGPRCSNLKTGPLERALVGTPVADPQNPLEVIRVVHSFDPCVACGVHVLDLERNQTYDVKLK